MRDASTASAGRCARQGDPGTLEPLFSLEDPLLQDYGGMLRVVGRDPAASRWSSRSGAPRPSIPPERRRLFRADDKLTQMLSFSGSSE